MSVVYKVYKTEYFKACFQGEGSIFLKCLSLNYTLIHFYLTRIGQSLGMCTIGVFVYLGSKVI